LDDYGALDELRPKDLRVQSVLPLTHPGNQFLRYASERLLGWWKRLILRLASFGAMPLEPDPAKHRFGAHFQIESLSGGTGFSTWRPGYAACRMTRKPEGQA